MELDTLVKIGWTALLGWNLRETVSNGKDISALKAKIENGLTHNVAQLKAEIEQYIHRDPKLRTRHADRKRDAED